MLFSRKRGRANVCYIINKFSDIHSFPIHIPMGLRSIKKPIILGSEAWGNKTKEMYFSLLNLRRCASRPKKVHG